MSAVPVPDPAVERERRRILLTGDLPSPTEDIPGCNFASRCPLFRLLDDDRQATCLGVDPTAVPHGVSKVACHHVDQIGRLDDVDISALSPTGD